MMVARAKSPTHAKADDARNDEKFKDLGERGGGTPVTLGKAHWPHIRGAAACGNVLLHVLMKGDGVQNHAVCVCDRFGGVPEGLIRPMSARDGIRSVRACIFTSVALVLGQSINA
jgi:hypothetical protein